MSRLFVSTAVTRRLAVVLSVQTIEFDDGAGAVLRIQPLRAPRDENVYECVARNSEGEVSVTSKLSIMRGKAQRHTSTNGLRHAFSFTCALLASAIIPASLGCRL